MPNRRGGRAASSAGEATLKRALLTSTLVRGTRKERSALLGQAGGVSSEHLTSPPIAMSQFERVWLIEESTIMIIRRYQFLESNHTQQAIPQYSEHHHSSRSSY